MSNKIYPIGVQNFESLRKDLHLDLNAKKFDTPEDLIRLIDRQLFVFEQEYGSVSSDVTIDDRLVSLIRNALLFG